MAEEVNKQVIPSWAGFNAILYPEMTRFRNIGYCPMIAESLDRYELLWDKQHCYNL